MNSSGSDNTIVINHNHWRVPSVEGALSGILEGCPSEARRQEIVTEVMTARATWTPCPEGMELVEQMRSFIGCRVQIQFWDSIMFWLEEEGPFPAEADCVGVTLLQEGDFLQAYLLVRNMNEITNKDGYSPNCYFQQRVDHHQARVSVADVYSITEVGVTQP